MGHANAATINVAAFFRLLSHACPTSQWDREIIEKIRVTKFPTAKIAVLRKLFSRMKHRVDFKVIVKDQTGGENPSGPTIVPHPAPGAQYQLAWFAR